MDTASNRRVPARILGQVALASGVAAAWIGGAAWQASRYRDGARWGWALASLAGAGLTGLGVWMHAVDVDLPGRTLQRGSSLFPRVALTFDDGPNGDQTLRLLDVLAQHEAQATFFVVGDAARRWPALVRRMMADGHVVGNHTQTHRLLRFASPADVAREVSDAQSTLSDILGTAPRWMRAPKGWKSPFLPSILREQGLRLAGWTRGVWDTDRPGIETITERSRLGLVPGAILLLHDGLPGTDRTQTVAAIPTILREIRERGLIPVHLDDLVRPEPLDHEQGIVRPESRADLRI